MTENNRKQKAKSRKEDKEKKTIFIYKNKTEGKTMGKILNCPQSAHNSWHGERASI